MKVEIMINKVIRFLFLTLFACSSVQANTVNLKVNSKGKLIVNGKNYKLDKKEFFAEVGGFRLEKLDLKGDTIGQDIEFSYNLNGVRIFTVEDNQNEIYRINIFSKKIKVPFYDKFIKIGDSIERVSKNHCLLRSGEGMGTYVDCGLPSKIIFYTDCEPDSLGKCLIEKILLNSYP